MLNFPYHHFFWEHGGSSFIKSVVFSRKIKNSMSYSNMTQCSRLRGPSFTHEKSVCHTLSRSMLPPRHFPSFFSFHCFLLYVVIKTYREEAPPRFDPRQFSFILSRHHALGSRNASSVSFLIEKWCLFYLCWFDLVALVSPLPANNCATVTLHSPPTWEDFILYLNRNLTRLTVSFFLHFTHYCLLSQVFSLCGRC